MNSPGGHSVTGLFGGGLHNGHGVPGPGQGGGMGIGGGPHSFLNGGSSMANLGLMTSTHMPPANIHSQSPTSVLSNYSLNRNLNQLNLNLVPRTNRY